MHLCGWQGGLAGGEKFIVGTILFKFANDHRGIYKGSHERAQKAAALEVVALNAVQDLGVQALHCPLAGLFRFVGNCTGTRGIDTS